jgi:hypothetical protein
VLGTRGTATVYARSPWRISTLAPLAEVTLSSNTVWIRTSDNGLRLAPSQPGHGLTWGYRGAGPSPSQPSSTDSSTTLLGRPVAYERSPDGMESLIQNTPREQTTTYSRAQLLAARREAT